MRFEPLASLCYRVTGAQLRRKQGGSVLGQLAASEASFSACQIITRSRLRLPQALATAPRPTQSAALGPALADQTGLVFDIL